MEEYMEEYRIIGQRVTCKINGVDIKDAKMQREGDRWFICQNLINYNSCENTLGYKYSYDIANGSGFARAYSGVEDLKKNNNMDLKPFKETLEDVEEGDILIDDYGNKRLVLGRAGRMVWLSNNDEEPILICNAYAHTIRQLKKKGFKFEEEKEEVLELTLDKIAEKFGKDVKNIKVKK
jgi:hypothetical protein